MRKAIMALALLGAVPAFAQQKPTKQQERLLAMTPSDFASKVSIADDDMELVATLSTENGFQEKHGLVGVVWNDTFMRAFIDKKTGVAKFQLVERISYVASTWRFYNFVNYEAHGGLASTELTKIGSNVDCVMSNIMGGCTYTELVGFDISEWLADRIASYYAPSQMVGWKYKFKAQAGQDFSDAMTPAEVAGLVQRVAEYRSAHQLPTPQLMPDAPSS